MCQFLIVHGRSRDFEKLRESIFGDREEKHAEEMDEALILHTVGLGEGGGPHGWGEEFNLERVR